MTAAWPVLIHLPDCYCHHSSLICAFPCSHSFPAISFPLCQPVKSKLAVKSSDSARSSAQAPGEDKWYELYGPTVKYSIEPQWDIQKSFLKASSLDCFPFQRSFPTVDLLLFVANHRERIKGKQKDEWWESTASLAEKLNGHASFREWRRIYFSFSDRLRYIGTSNQRAVERR